MTNLRNIVTKVIGEETPEQKKAKTQKGIKRAQLQDEIADLEIKLENLRQQLEKL